MGGAENPNPSPNSTTGGLDRSCSSSRDPVSDSARTALSLECHPVHSVNGTLVRDGSIKQVPGATEVPQQIAQATGSTGSILDSIVYTPPRLSGAIQRTGASVAPSEPIQPPKPDGAITRPDVATTRPNVAPARTDAAVPRPGVAVPKPEVAAAKPDVPLAPISAQSPLSGRPPRFDVFHDHDQWQQAEDKFWVEAGKAKGEKPRREVTRFAPFYDGPPIDKPKAKSTLPSLGLMLDQAPMINRLAFRDKTQPEFKLNEIEEPAFKKRYADEAIRVGQAHGFNKSQVETIVRDIYAYEDGGWGKAGALANTPEELMADNNKAERLAFIPSSSAIGYNQLLFANTVSEFELHGDAIAGRLEEMGKADPKRAAELHAKAQMVTALHQSLDTELMAMAKGNTSAYLEDNKPNDALFNAFSNSTTPGLLGMTGRQFAMAVQTLNMDGDIGPIIQRQELSNLMDYADARNPDTGKKIPGRPTYKQLLDAHFDRAHKAADDYDHLSVAQKDQAIKEIIGLMKPPKSLIEHPDAAKQKEYLDTKASIEAKLHMLQNGMDKSFFKDGLSDKVSSMVSTDILTLKRYGEPTGELTEPAKALLDKISYVYFGGPTSDQLMPAAMELANLAGPGRAFSILQADGAGQFTTNYFAQLGYERNKSTNGRTGDELLMEIHRMMNGSLNDPRKHQGVAEFIQAFKELK